MLHIYRQITALRGFRPVVFCQKRENAVTFPFPDVRILPKPATHQWRRLWQKQIRKRPISFYRSEARRLDAGLREVDARLLHIFFGHIGVHLLPWLRLRSLPAVVSFHGADAGVDLDNPAHAEATQEMFREATLVLARSESLAERIRAEGCPAEKVRIHRTGLPLAEITAAVREIPADGQWRCVQASRLIPKKGLGTTMRAFCLFREKFPNATLTFAGEGPSRSVLEALAEELSIRDAVRFTGFLPQPELRELYASSHLFLHPSETGEDGNQEGVPNAMLEAMASGLPPLATYHGGIPEAVEHERTGLLVPERDHEALAAAMIRLANSPDLYRSISAATAESVRRNFDLAEQARVLEGHYAEAIERFRAGIR